MKNHRSFFIFLPFIAGIALSFLGCKKEEVTPSPFVDISCRELNVSFLGGMDSVIVRSNMDWRVISCPDWCSIAKSENCKILRISVSPNLFSRQREGVIKIGNEKNKRELCVRQTGKYSSFGGIKRCVFPVNSIVSIDCESRNNRFGDFSICHIVGERLFVNNKINRNIYHGDIINKEINGFDHMLCYPDYVCDSISISCLIGSRVFTKIIHPSIQSVNEMVDEIVKFAPGQNLRLFYNSAPILYNSREELNLLGMCNLWIALDEIVFGESYKKREMAYRSGLIYSYCIELFNIELDYQNEIVNKKRFSTPQMLKNLSYINSVHYGRTALLFIETNSTEKEVTCIIEKITNQEGLNNQEMEIVRMSSVSYLHFAENQKPIVETGKVDVIRDYVNGANSLPIMPLSFSTASCLDHSNSYISLNIIR